MDSGTITWPHTRLLKLDFEGGVHRIKKLKIDLTLQVSHAFGNLIYFLSVIIQKWYISEILSTVPCGPEPNLYMPRHHQLLGDSRPPELVKSFRTISLLIISCIFCLNEACSSSFPTGAFGTFGFVFHVHGRIDMYIGGCGFSYCKTLGYFCTGNYVFTPRKSRMMIDWLEKVHSVLPFGVAKADW